MTENQVPPRSTAKLDQVEGDLRVGRRARLESASGKITVSGAVYFEGGADVNCSLECDRLRVDHFGVVRVAGDLIVHTELDIIHSIEVSGATSAATVVGEGKILSNSLTAKKIRVNGVMEVKTDLKAEESIEVNGKLDVPGHVNLHDFTVTGQATIGGGEMSGHVDVKGKLEAESKVEFGDLHILGSARLPSGCKGVKVSTFGKLTTSGDFECNQIEVQGTTRVQGNCECVKAWVRGKLDVSGSLIACDALETFGTTEVSQNYTGKDLRVGGKLFANKAVLTGDADIAGRMESNQGLKAKSIIIRSGSRCKSPIMAETVDVGSSYMNVRSFQTDWLGQSISMRLIGKESKVEDIYATNVSLGAASRADKIFAQNVQLEKGCIVDQITYTGELKLPEGPKSIYINHPPDKVKKLPSPPL